MENGNVYKYMGTGSSLQGYGGGRDERRKEGSQDMPQFQHFLKEDTAMNMWKKCSSSLMITEMQTNTMLRCHCAAVVIGCVRMAKRIPDSGWQGRGERTPKILLIKQSFGAISMGNDMGTLSKKPQI